MVQTEDRAVEITTSTKTERMAQFQMNYISLRDFIAALEAIERDGFGPNAEVVVTRNPSDSVIRKRWEITVKERIDG